MRWRTSGAPTRTPPPPVPRRARLQGCGRESWGAALPRRSGRRAERERAREAREIGDREQVTSPWNIGRPSSSATTTCIVVTSQPCVILLTRSVILLTSSVIRLTRSVKVLTRSVILLTRSVMVLTRSVIVLTRSVILLTRSVILLTRSVIVLTAPTRAPPPPRCH